MNGTPDLSQPADTDPPALFDADRYLVPGKRPRRPRRKPPAPEVLVVRTTRIWQLFSRRTPGVLHARCPDSPRCQTARRSHPGGSHAACGLPALAFTIEAGQRANGCHKCAEKVGTPT